MARITHHIKW